MRMKKPIFGICSAGEKAAHFLADDPQKLN
jgi:hypothetical protein